MKIECENCDNINLRDSFYSPKDYLNCLGYIQELLETDNFVLIEKSCDFEKIKNENGCWNNDIIIHVIQCKKCGEYFTCIADTYHGSGNFKIGR